MAYPDYDRTHFAPAEVQQKYFRTYYTPKVLTSLDFDSRLGVQLSLAKRWRLPLFLHSRAAHTDFVQILREEGFGEDGGRNVGANGGVVHSFTGTVEEAAELVSVISPKTPHTYVVYRLVWAST